VNDACGVEDISADKLLNLADVAGQVMPSVSVSAAQTVEIGHGKSIFLEAPVGVGKDDPIAAVDPTGRLVAIVSIESGRSRILVGFPAE
jgi:tRNA pseudouridine55 synthase